jgi:phage baseplate assembly protein W
MPIVTSTIDINPTRTFSDLDISFAKHPTKRDVARKIGSAAVIQSVRNLVLMNFYEKPFQPWIGCNARRLLFENLTPITASVLKDTILEVVTRNEPRVQVSECTVTANYDMNAYSVTLVFYINNQTAPTTVSFILERIR